MELIKIQTYNGKQVVSARELHGFLQINSKFADWIKRRIQKYGFIESQDFTTLSQNRETGGTDIEYAITLDMAKELAMVEGNDKGKQARRYFIECEKQLKVSTPASRIDALLQSVQLLKEQEMRISKVESKVDMILEDRETAVKELRRLDRSTEQMPEETERDKIRRLVNAYARAKNIGTAEVWNTVYDRLYYRYHIAVKKYNKLKTESYLDVAERIGFLDKLFIIASNELT